MSDAPGHSVGLSSRELIFLYRIYVAGNVDPRFLI